MHYAAKVSEADDRRTRALAALERLLDSARLSALEGLRRQSDGTLLIVPILPVVTDNQRHWRLAAIGYGVDNQRKELWRMEQINSTSDFSTTPNFPTLPAAATPGWQRTFTPGFASLDTALLKNGLRVDAGVEFLRLDGSAYLVHLIRTVSYNL